MIDYLKTEKELHITIKNTGRDQIWRLYKGLKKYKENPNSKDKKRLDSVFDKIFTKKRRAPL